LTGELIAALLVGYRVAGRAPAKPTLVQSNAAQAKLLRVIYDPDERKTTRLTNGMSIR